MPDIKEKPKIGQLKEKRQEPGPTRQAGRLMREKFAQELDQRKEMEAEDSAYAVDQVEQAGQRGADEFICSFQQDQQGRRNDKSKGGKSEKKDDARKSPENSGTEGEAPPADGLRIRPKSGGVRMAVWEIQRAPACMDKPSGKLCLLGRGPAWRSRSVAKKL